MDRLVDKGLVQRAPDPNDRRVVTIGLTSRGADAMEQFWRIGRMKIEALAEPLNPRELETVVTAMELLVRASKTNAMTGLKSASCLATSSANNWQRGIGVAVRPQISGRPDRG